MRRTLLGVLVMPALCLWVPSAWATLDDLKSYKEAYPGKEPKAYSCKVCHQGAVGKQGDLNIYGTALQTLKGEGQALKLTVDDYRAIEPDDADEDGVSNLDEINAGTNPGDPASMPAAEEPAESGAWLRWQLTPVAEAATDEPAAATTPQAEYVGTETCAACHDKEFQEFQHSTHARIAIPGESAQGCETCHGPGSLHAEAGGGKGVGGIINPRQDPSPCFGCHLDKKIEFRLPYHHPLLEGKMSCADCHNAHGEDVRPWSATSLEGVNQACFKCHKEQRGPFVYEHEALREGCASCHKVHGSIHPAMLLVRDSNLCLRCHTQVNFPTIGDSSHSSRLLEGSCFSAGCHTAPHGSNFDDHLRY